MDPSPSAPITFVIPGQRDAARTLRGATPAAPSLPGGLRSGTVKESVRVGANRDAGAVRVAAVPGEDVVVLSLEGGPELVLHPETARDLLLAQAGPSRGAAGVQAGAEVLVGSTLRWPSTAAPVSRGALTDRLGGVVLKAVDVVTGVFKDRAAELTAAALARRVDAQVDPGVYRLNAHALPPLKGTPAVQQVEGRPDGKPLLVFVHGTFSNTSGAFQKLWQENPRLVERLFDHYDQSVYGLDHPTLGVSPIANALALAESLPGGAAVHLLTHSRGGLVAEVLARTCGRPVLSAAELRSFPEDQRAQLQALAALVKDRQLRVDRVVRVACPARGTLLASKRVDAYLSVFRWTLQLAGVPVLPELVDFLAAVARERADPETMPGLEAQVPDSPLIRWLHGSPEPIPGELRIVAGDVEGDSVTSWIKTLLADGFYWTDNDFVVHTRSMYGGARRRAGATFLLDQGGKVSHSAYFAKTRAAERVVEALVEDAPRQFRVVGPLSWKGESSSGERAARAGDTPQPDKPALLVIPGFAASRLAAGGVIVWPASLSIQALGALEYPADGRTAVAPQGLVGNAYDDLLAACAATHDTIAFAYDWRLPLEVEAERLAEAIDDALTVRRATGQPVRLLAHSSGGLLARVVQLVRPDVWDRMMAVPGARLLMLGTPNAGFWMPMQVLSGDETFGGLLTEGAPPFGEADVRAAMGTYPGLLQLQAGLLDPAYGLGDRARWEQLADGDVASERAVQSWHALPLQRHAYTWGVPSADALVRAVALRERLDAQAQAVLPTYARQIVMVLGSAAATPGGFDTSSGRFMYLDMPGQGDGRVTTPSARLRGIDAWAIDCGHAALASRTDAFAGYLELLQQGTTASLPKAEASAASRGAETMRPIPNRPSRTGAVRSVPERESEILTGAAAPHRADSPRGRALHIRVVNGDLTFVRQPLILGHYRSMRLTGTELVMDALIGGAMTRSLDIGSYPEPPGTNQIFVNTRVRGQDALRVPRPEAVVVVGLGEEGKLTAAELVRTVRQGVIAWAQRASERPGAPSTFDLAATLIGSGGKGMPVQQSAQLVADAVREADELLEQASLPRVAELQIVELFLDRATEAWRALQLQEEAAPARYVVADTIAIGTGQLRRPLDSNYRGADYDFISAVPSREKGAEGIVYSLDTKRARTEVTAHATQTPLLSELLNSANSLAAPSDIGRTLFTMLVPLEIEPFLGGSTDMLIEVEGGTAGIPWELLDTDNGARQENKPWAIRSKLVRKLRTAEFRPRVSDAATDDRILIIGEPQCDTSRYLRLPGARAEANAVYQAVSARFDPDRVARLISPDDEELPGPSAVAVLSALYRHPWRIIHIAGHGEPTTEQCRGGVVLSPTQPGNVETFLSATEINTVRVVPELVFVNCCHLAARDRMQLLAPDSPFRHHYDRPAFAAGLAEQLIRIGVRCVVAAGWAVDDTAAKEFATTFYRELLEGSRFIDAAAAARDAAWRLGGNTWAAYQCYGDPEWTFRRHPADGQRPRVEKDWAAGVASPRALTLALDTVATQARFQVHTDPDREAARVRQLREGVVRLERRFGEMWSHFGAVAEAFATARAEIGDLQEAIGWYDRALSANDGLAAIRAAEQAANLRARMAWQKVAGLVAADEHPDALERLHAAAAEIEEAIRPLEMLAALAPTVERESLIGAAYKRIALVWGAAADGERERAAIEQMRIHYRLAERIALDQKDADIFYPAMNRITADLVLHAGAPDWAGLEADAVASVRQFIAAKLRDDPDFWSAAGEIELRLFEALAARALEPAREDLERDFAALHQRVPAARMWKSVYDNETFVTRAYVRRLRAQAAADPALAERWNGEADAAEGLLSLLRRLAGVAGATAPAGT